MRYLQTGVVAYLQDAFSNLDKKRNGMVSTKVITFKCFSLNISFFILIPKMDKILKSIIQKAANLARICMGALVPYVISV